MGRPRKPTSLKILDGDRADRIHGDEPTAPAGVGEAPDWLDRFGREAWAALVAHHVTSGLLTLLDVEMLTLYAQSYSSYRHALADISRDVAAEKEGRRRKCHPMYRVVNEAHRQMMRVLARFGMSPSDRAGLHMQSSPQDDDLMRFLARPTADVKPKPIRPKRE